MCGGRQDVYGFRQVRCRLEFALAVTYAYTRVSKDIMLELPVTVYHPSALDITSDLVRAGSPAPVHLFDPSPYMPPVSPIPYGNMSPPPQDYPLPWRIPPVIPFVDNGQVYFPAATPVPFYEVQPYVSQPQAQAQPFLNPPHAPPARPASVEPVPSSPIYRGVPGLPASSVQQPLPLIGTGAPQVMQREEGKGERASRISHHLRVSSRARSVSPQSHRYTMHNEPPPQDVHAILPHPISIPNDERVTRSF